MDTTNNLLFTSKDDCRSLKLVNLNFKPSDISFHNSKQDGLIAYDDDTKKVNRHSHNMLIITRSL